MNISQNADMKVRLIKYMLGLPILCIYVLSGCGGGDPGGTGTGAGSAQPTETGDTSNAEQQLEENSNSGVATE